MADDNPTIQSPTDDSTIDPLLDLANYLDAVTFFSLLQDQGSLPTAKQSSKKGVIIILSVRAKDCASKWHFTALLCSVKVCYFGQKWHLT